MTHVLVTDDHAQNRYLLRATLEGHGFRVSEARNGAEALEAARRDPPGLVIADLLMPVMDGYTLLRHWKSDERLRRVPFVVYTATYTEPADEQLALDLGADAFILKPAEPETFVTRIREIAEHSSSAPARPGPDPGPGGPAVLESYNRVLVAKLESKAQQLEQANLELTEARERLELAVRAGKVGLWELDLATDTITFSPEWMALFGEGDWTNSCSREEWVGRIHADDRARVETVIREFLAGDGPDFAAEYRVRRPGGGWRHVLSRGSEVRDAGGRRVQVHGSHVDLTEIHDLHARYLQAQKLESVGRLAGGIAHDFNNVLTVIMSTAELALQRAGDDEVLREDLGQILRTGERAASLTRQLLAFSRRQILKPEVIDLTVVVRGMQGMLRRLLEEHIELSLTTASEPCFVRADRSQIEQVVLNLVVNARDAMPDGGRLDIAVTAAAGTDPGAGATEGDRPGGVLLVVRDAGHGMDLATRQRIFEPFFTTKGPAQGTGLGLATVYGIVEQSGGRIEVESEPGRGTEFRIGLPRVDPPEELPAVPSPPAPARRTGTVLVLEDDETLREITVRVLRVAGFEVLAAADGGQALALAAGYPGELHLVLSDVLLPGMGGREVVERLQRARPGLRALYTSGHTDDAVLRQGVRDASMHFIAKPYTMPELVRRVREVLEGRPPAGGAG